MTDPLVRSFQALATRADGLRPVLRLGRPRAAPARPLSILLPVLATGSALVVLAVLVVGGALAPPQSTGPFTAETDRLFDPYAPAWPLAAAADKD
jgi:hypothetical protein